MPIRDFITVLEKSKKNASCVKSHWENNEGRLVTHGGRRWCPLSFPQGKAETIRKYEANMSDTTSWIVDTDIFCGLASVKNASKLSNRSDMEILNTIGKSIEVTDASFQWRSGQLKTFQIAHANGEKRFFNIIVPLTNVYTLGFHPGTHHVVTTKKEAEKS